MPVLNWNHSVHRSRWLLFSVWLLLAATQPLAVEAGEPLIVAHRGLLQHAPENTLSNFRACLELRLGFEFDVKQTQDGHLVCIHDDTVDRTTDGRGRVDSLTLAELRQLDAGRWFHPDFAGERVPTIDEVFALVAEYRQRQVLIAVDLKDADGAARVVQLAQRHEVLPRLLFIGRPIADAAMRAELKRAAAEATTAAVANNPDELAAALSAPDADWVYLRFLPTTAAMAAIRDAGKRSFIAGPTVGGHLPENWRQATTAGVDAILTDFPLELRRVLREKEAGEE